jgi:hypothetical protein
MNQYPNRLTRLLALARRAPRTPVTPPEPEPAPLGFSTRVVAQVREKRQRHSGLVVWERLCWFGAGAAVVVCLAAGVHAHHATPQPSGLELLLMQTEAPLFP